MKKLAVNDDDMSASNFKNDIVDSISIEKGSCNNSRSLYSEGMGLQIVDRRIGNRVRQAALRHLLRDDHSNLTLC